MRYVINHWSVQELASEWFGQLVQQHRGGGTRIFLNNSFNEFIDKIIYRGNRMLRMFFELTK